MEGTRGMDDWWGDLEREILESLEGHGDRKSTRLNSSHSQISYAVFCLKKKKKKKQKQYEEQKNRKQIYTRCNEHNNSHKCSTNISQLHNATIRQSAIAALKSIINDHR